MDEIYVPVTHFFENGNSFTGSAGALRFLLTPDEEQITAKIWYGQFCLEKSEVQEQRAFPLSDAGRAELLAWLTEKRPA